jgi:hypothetical protein
MRSSLGKNVEMSFQIGIDTCLAFSTQTLDFVQSKSFQKAFESLQIINKKGEQQSLIRNKHQEELWQWYLACRQAQIAARGICLKPRQTGISTFWMGLFILDVVMRQKRFAYTASFEDESAIHLFDMGRFYYDNMPPELRSGKRLRKNHKLAMWFAKPHYSKFTSATARRRNLASSQTIHDLHLSEIAKWPSSTAKDTYLSIMQCVPDHWDTCVFIESTAQGMNMFKNMWDKAKSHRSGFTPFFFSWVGFPEYFFYFEDRNRPLLSPEILQLQRDCGCCDEQAAWAQTRLDEKCQGDMDLFLQEYPWSEQVAFRYSGHKWFDVVALEKLGLYVMNPAHRGRLEWLSSEGHDVKFVEHRLGDLQIWEKPQHGRKYVISADVGAGIGGNFTVINVIKVPKKLFESPEQVAKVKSNRIGAFHAAEWLFQLGVWYNWAYVGVEVNNMGHETAGVLQRGTGDQILQMRDGYPFLHYHTKVDGKTREETRRIGWLTTVHSKKLQFQHFKDVVKMQDLVVHSNDTMLEMQGLSYDEQHKIFVMMYTNPITDDQNDDEVDSMAIALQLLVHRPETADFEEIPWE